MSMQELTFHGSTLFKESRNNFLLHHLACFTTWVLAGNYRVKITEAFYLVQDIVLSR